MRLSLRELLRKVLKAILTVGVLGVLAIAILLGSVWVEGRSKTTLPAPTGPFAVGRTAFAWSDATHVDPFAPPGTKRELLAWIWFPAAPAQHSPPEVEEYLPAPLRIAIEDSRVALINLLTRDLSRVRVHSIRDSSVSPQDPSYPVVIMLGSTGFTSLAEDLASYGYVVVGPEVPYRSSLVVFPDGRVIGELPQNNPEVFSGPQKESLAIKLQAAWSADIGFALDQLERLNASDPSGKFVGRLDLQRVGVIGHSLGGAIALQFCHDDSRCKAGIDIDGAPHGNVIAEGVTQPFMFLLSDHSSESGPVAREIDANIRSIYDRLPGDGRIRLTIRGANHYSFSDDAMLKSQIVRGVLRTVGILGINGRRQVVLTAHCIHSFLDVHLKGVSGSGLKYQAEYPEIQFE